MDAWSAHHPPPKTIDFIVRGDQPAQLVYDDVGDFEHRDEAAICLVRAELQEFDVRVLRVVAGSLRSARAALGTMEALGAVSSIVAQLVNMAHSLRNHVLRCGEDTVLLRFVALPMALAVLVRLAWSGHEPRRSRGAAPFAPVTIMPWLLLSMPVSAQATPVAQVHALEALYAAAGGEGWVTKTNWMSGDPCTAGSIWYGVTCSGGNVTSLHLNDNGLNGTLPSEVGQLTAITQSL